MARMSIDDTIERDPRITKLASVLKMDRDAVVGALVCRVWPICYDQGEHTISIDLVDLAARRDGFAAAMVAAELAESVRGNRKVRIKGARERIEYLADAKENGRVGGLKSGESRRRKRRGGGSDPEGSSNPNTPDPSPPPVPDPSSVPPPDPVCAPDPVLRPERARERHPEAGRIAEATWQHGSRAASVLRATNVVAPPWSPIHDSHHSGWVAILDRACESLVARTTEQALARLKNRIDVGAAMASRDGDGSYFTPSSLFSRKSFDSFVDLTPQQVARKPTAKKSNQDRLQDQADRVRMLEAQEAEREQGDPRD